MNKYSIVYSQQAIDDIDALYFVIINEYKTYRTAERYVDGLENTIKELMNNAENFVVQNNNFFNQYRNQVRRINYKKMTIIYTVVNSIVTIRRIIPQSLVTE